MVPEPNTIKVSLTDAKERKRRQRELFLAFLLVVLCAIFSWVELTTLGVDSYSFLILFNINFILLILVLFIVLRNVVKLVLERRRRVLGSKLRTRLVLIFISLSIFPTLIMFFLSTRVMQTSMDYWFKSKIETTMETTMDVGQSTYSFIRTRLEQQSNYLVDQIRARNFAWGGKAMDNFLHEKQREYSLSLLAILHADKRPLNWHGTSSADPLWAETQKHINWDALNKQPRFWSLLWPGQSADYAVSVMPVDQGKTGYLVLVSQVDTGLIYKLENIVRGLDEYNKLKELKYPLKLTLYFILGVLTLLIILGSMWFGFRLAKELAAPIQALAEGTERIARGELTVRLQDTATDELGGLVRSFNHMADDLEQNRNHITEANKQLARQNQEQEQRNRYIEAVLDNIAAGVISLDANGRISTVNKAAGAIFNVSPAMLIGVAPSELLSGENVRLFREMSRQFRAAPDSQWQRQMTLNVAGHEWKLLVNAVSLTQNGLFNGLVAVFEDITELEKMQRMAAWREVARRIAHEIKNPLTPIKLSAQRLQRKFGANISDPVFPQCTGLIVQQVEHLQEMVQEFSAFAKLPEVQLLPKPILPLLEELTTLFSNSHARIHWQLEASTTLPPLNIDTAALERAFMNILNNAAEVLEGVAAPRVNITVEHDKSLHLVCINIADNGPGLTKEERSRLFEPYFSHKKGGTGLGLTIVKSIVQDHRGYIRASSNTYGGTTISVELPEM